MVEKNNYSVEFIYCACGCGFTTWKYVIDHGKPRLDMPKKFKQGHQMIGRKLPESTRKIQGEVHKGEKNHNWMGDDVGYCALHAWIRKHLPPQKVCEMCKQVPPEDVANLTGLYNRDFNNWARFCHKCHLLFDNLIERNLRMKRWENKNN